MDPISFAIIAALSSSLVFIGVQVIYVIWLTLQKIREYFVRLKQKIRMTGQDIGFVTNQIQSNKCNHVYGIFNQQNGKVKAYELMDVKDIDESVKNQLKETGTILIK
jgi:hypothetical protein